MIFWQLFWTFIKIGAFTFGGGYAMIALIQSEVVDQRGWMAPQEFTDIVAVSQATPGPVGINVATYAGYTAARNAGHGQAAATAAAALASLAVITPPFALTLLVCRLASRRGQRPATRRAMHALRLAVVGMILAAAGILVTPENFGAWADAPRQVVISALLCAATFVAAYRFKTNPIALLAISALVGLVAY